MIWRVLALAIAIAGVWYVLNTTSQTPGFVSIRWFGYEIEMSALVLAGAGVVITLIGFGLGELYAWLISIPSRFKAKKWLKLQRKGDELLLRQSITLLTGDSAGRKLQKQDQKLLAGPIADNPRNLAIRLQQAQLLEKENQPEKAYDLYKTLTAYKDVSAVAHLGLANINGGRGDWPVAIPQIEYYLKNHPNSSKGLDLLFQAQLCTQDFETAWKTLSNLRKHDVYAPELLDLHTAGLALHFAKNSDETIQRGAKQKVQEALKYLPGCWPLQEALLGLEKTKNAAGLRKVYAKTWQASQRLDTFKAWFRTLKDDRPDAMLKHIRSLTKKGANKGQNWLCEGWGLLELNQISSARRALMKAAELTPNKLVFELLAQLATAEKPGPSSDREKFFQQALTAAPYTEPNSAFDAELEQWLRRYVGSVPVAA
jgi:uncharacterized membrane-anchored protein